MKRVLAVIISVALIATLSLGVSMFVSADDADPTIVVSSETVCQGSTVDVKISLKNNPGIASMKLQVSFPEGLSLVSLGEDTYDGNYVTIEGEELEATNVTDWVKYDIADVKGSVFQPEKGTSPVTLNWVSPLENVTGDVTFATLKFKAAEDAELGDKDITVTYDAEDVFSVDKDNTPPEENVTFAVENGKVTVTDVLKGDVDGSGEVDSDDAIYLLYYTFYEDEFPVNQTVDFDGSGEVDSDDAIYLLYYTFYEDEFPLH